MLSVLWTAAVRAIAVLTAGLAVAVIVTSLYAARAEAGPRAASLQERGAEPEPLAPVRAVQEAPAGTYEAPTDALPATRARSLSAVSAASERRQAQSLPTRPLVAVLDVGRDGGAAMERLALAVKASLEARGHEVYLVPEGVEPGTSAEEAVRPAAVDVPQRPDAYVTLRGVAGASGRTRPVDVWFCELEASLSGRLAHIILDETLASLADGYETENGEAGGGIEGPEAFRCDVLLAGRAHMPAVLLELSPAALEAPQAGDGVARGIAGAVDQFFLRHGDSLLREEDRRRMLWPAVGPVTSRFGPGHPLGIDIGQWRGAVVAATDGTVSFAGGDPCCSYGLFVVIESPEGIITLYGHFDSIAVKRGQRVRQGQPLGIIGCTGHCSGTHLHFEVIEGGVRRDPLSYLP